MHDFGCKNWPPLKIIDKLKDRKPEAKTDKSECADATFPLDTHLPSPQKLHIELTKALLESISFSEDGASSIKDVC